MAATWAHKDTGLLVGLLVGALTIGTAFPHLLNAVGGVNWRFTLAATSVMALCSALLVNSVKLGSALGMRSRLDPTAVFKAWSNKALRLANLSYTGHMWEFYAMWAWVGLFVHASFLTRPEKAYDEAKFLANLARFAVIGTGVAG